MSRFVATEEYNQALKLGQKEYKEASAAGKQLHPLVWMSFCQMILRSQLWMLVSWKSLLCVL